MNSFEQLCINYANEKLQGHFIDAVGRLQQQDYVREGIDAADLSFPDNSAQIILIDGKLGVLALLDEECALPKVKPPPDWSVGVTAVTAVTAVTSLSTVSDGQSLCHYVPLLPLLRKVTNPVTRYVPLLPPPPCPLRTVNPRRQPRPRTSRSFIRDSSTRAAPSPARPSTRVSSKVRHGTSRYVTV